MRIFISSVRRGLEQERDALPGLIQAIGHEPVRFEDFTAQSVPSREACLAGIASADAYILLLGAHYGHRFPDTNQSPTHDEWVAARATGKPTFVFRKEGVVLEPEQQAFVDEIGDYGSGVFYNQFSDVSDLQIKVAKALRAHAAQPSPLKFTPIDAPLTIEWRDHWPTTDRNTQEWNAILELHAVSVNSNAIPGRVMLAMPDRIAGSLRNARAVSMTAGMESSGDTTVAEVRVVSRLDRSSVVTGKLLGVRMSARGQLSVWWSLPRDTMGSILDAAHLNQTVTEGLHLVGALNVLTGEDFGVAVGLSGALNMTSRGTVASVARQSATMVMSPRPIHISLDEGVSAAAFDQGAAEVAQHLAVLVLAEFDRLR
jgi:hypothetical protein